TRLRRMGYVTSHLSVFMEPEGQDIRRGWQRGGLSGDRHFPLTADTFKLLEAADDIWDKAAACMPPRARLRYVGVACTGLREVKDMQPDLFGWTPAIDDDQQSRKLLTAIDMLNTRFGKDTVTLGPQTAIA